jgi:PKD repeat protein
MEGGRVHRIVYTPGNQAPTARATATPTAGDAPLTVAFDGTGSSDPEGRPLAFSWDLNGDGTFGDATGATATHTYTSSGVVTAGLRVTDDVGATDTDTVTITIGNTAPNPVIDTPGPSLTWQVGQVISFSGHADDVQEGRLPASALTWQLILHHCSSTAPNDCHTHALQDFAGTAGSFSAPDHSYPSWLELRLTATDSGGLGANASVRLDPRTVLLTFRTSPGGLKVAVSVNLSAQPTPFSTRVIVGSTNTVSAPSPQTVNRSTYYFSSWSDGGAQSHTIVAPSINTTYTATYRKR